MKDINKKQSSLQKITENIYCSIQKLYNYSMKLYHGSKQIIDKPIDKGSREDNDYGPAFYLTLDLESAHEWACRNNTIGFVNEYNLDLRGLKILDLRDKTKYSVLNWLAILMHFRTLTPGFKKTFAKRLSFLEENYYIDINQYDLVIGYRADDAYFRFPIDFIRGNLTYEQLQSSFELGDLGTQVVIMSNKGITKLKYVKNFISEEKYIKKYYQVVERATKKYDSFSKDEEGTRITSLMENKI